MARTRFPAVRTDGMPEDLEMVGRLLWHANLEPARVYAEWSDERLPQVVSGW